MTAAETQFRDRCRQLCARNPGLPRLKTGAAVGAYDAEIGGGKQDSVRLTAIFNFLLDSGFLIDPDFTIEAVNFIDDRDFLKETGPADFVFVACIQRDLHYLMDKFKSAADIRKHPQFPINLNWTLSRFHMMDFWHERLIQAGTKVVATYGGNTEVGSDFFAEDFCGLDHQVLIPTPEMEHCGYDSEWHKKLYPGMARKDLAFPWLGLTADRAYLRAIGSPKAEKP